MNADQYASFLSGCSRKVLASTLHESNRQAGIIAHLGGPDEMSKAELTSELCRRLEAADAGRGRNLLPGMRRND